MSLPNLTKVEEFLRPFMVANPDDRLRFGHITIPPYRFGKEGLIDSVRQLYDASRSKMLFLVAPKVEEIAGRAAGNSGDPVTLSFTDLFCVLREARSGDGGGWVTPKSHETNIHEAHAEWVQTRCLPWSITLVMWLDPEMSADCALALIGVVKWAAQVSQDGADVSVLTMQVGKDDMLSKVVSFVSPTSKVARFDLAAEAQQEPLAGSMIYDGQSLANVAGNILKSFREAPDRRRLVISFVPAIHQEMNKQFQNREGLSFQFGFINKNAPGAMLKWLKRPSKPSITRVAIFTCAACILPFEFQDLDEFHLVVGTNVQNDKVWDNSCVEVITKSRPSTEEERRLQLWWARQPSAKDKHVYTSSATVYLFAQGGPRHHLVENAQIGGFIASAVDLVTWGIDLGDVLQCFVRYPLRYMELLERLKRQGVIKPDSDGLALAENEASVFRTTLSSFDYDHRLALMVSLGSDREVLHVKVCLAVILSNGTTDVVERKAAGPKNRSKILASGRGISRSLQNEGVAWLALGLLNYYSTVTQSGSSEESGVFNDLVSVNQSVLTGMTQQVDKILALIQSADIPWEFDALSTEQEQELRSHLLRSFVYQITMVTYRNVNGKRLPENGIYFKTVAGLADCDASKAKDSSLTSLYDAAHQVKKGDGFAYVTAHSLHRSGDGKLFCQLWTFIPTECVREWLSQSSNKRLFEVLQTRIVHT